MKVPRNVSQIATAKLQSPYHGELVCLLYLCPCVPCVLDSTWVAGSRSNGALKEARHQQEWQCDMLSLSLSLSLLHSLSPSLSMSFAIKARQQLGTKLQSWTLRGVQ